MTTTTEQEKPRVYKIPEDRMSKFRSDVKTLNRRAVKLGIEEITYQEHGTELIEYKETVETGNLVHVKYTAVLVTVQGSVIKLAGWQFVACLDHIGEDENIVISDGPVPQEYRTCKPTCEHCHTNRMRHKTFVVKHETEGYKQVGSSCLVDFTGFKNADRVALLAEAVWEFCPSDYEEFDESTGRASKYIDIKSLVALSHKVIRTQGFISKKRAKESEYESEQLIPTAEIIAEYIEPKRDRRPEDKIEIEAEDTEAVKAILQWASEINADVNSEYMHNVRVVFQSGEVHYRYLGLVVAAVNTYLNSLKKKAETLTFKNEHFGTVKVRGTFDLKLLWTKAVDGYYGTTDMMKFVDSENRVAIWFNSGSRFLTPGAGYTWTEGITYRVKATVKKHDAYNGNAQTILNRVKWVETLEDPENKYGENPES